MSKTSVFKRIISTVLAAGMALGSMTSVNQVLAADQYYIRFYDPITKAISTNQTLVEGSPITIQAKLPDSYDFSMTPFAVRQTSGGASTPVPIADYFQIVTNTIGSNYSLTPKELTSGSSSEFTLEALYTANVKDGSAVISSPSDSRNFAVSAISEASIPITADSSLTFKVNSSQLEGDSTIAFSNVLTATGYFENKYDGEVVTAQAIAVEKGIRYIPVTIYPKTGSDVPTPLKFKIYLEGIPTNYLFLKDTVFRVAFTRQTISPLITTVINRQKAVDDTRDSVLQNPTTTGVTTTGESYIQLTSGETLQSIQNSFIVLSQIHRYNIDVSLEWKWKPDNDLYKDDLQVQRTNDPKKQAITIVQRREEDITGSLLVTATYNYTYVDKDGVTQPGSKSSTAGKIPIMIYGTGKPPTFTPFESYTGSQTGPDTVTQVTAFPQTMSLDVYSGKPAYAAGSSAPNAPYKLTTTMFFGDGRGKASRAVIKQNSNGGELEVYVEGSPVAYTFGTDILNVGNYKSLEIVAKKRGQTNLQVLFYNTNNELMSSYTVMQNFYVEDSTPSADGTLASLALKGFPTAQKKDIFEKVYPNSLISFDYEPDKNAYTIPLPNAVEAVTLTPKLTVGTGANTNIIFTSQADPVASGSASEKIALEAEIPVTVRITVTAQDGSTNSYTLTLLRQAPSNDSTLSSLEAYKTTDSNTNLITGFSPGVNAYAITVPYSTTELDVTAVPNSPWVTMDGNSAITWGGPVKALSLTERILKYFTKDQTSTTFTLNRPKAVDGVFAPSALTTITAKVTAEDGSTVSTYTLNVTCLAPSTNTNLKSLSVAGKTGTVYPFEYGITFAPNLKDYLVYIPYSTSTLTLTTQAEDDVTSLALALDAGSYSYTRVPSNYNPGIPTIFTIKNMDPVKFTGNDDPNMKPVTFSLTVTAESENVTNPPYTIELQRKEPSEDNKLKSLSVTDQDGTAVEKFSFNPEQLEYEFSVPYLTEKLILTPVVNDELSSVTVDGSAISTSRPSYTTKTLTAGTAQTITVVVTAENFTTRTYTIKVTREKPSTEARLSSLKVDSLTLKPKFNPNTLKYTLTIPEGTAGMTVTPTAVNQYATITVNEVGVKSGTASQKITPTDASSKVSIVVTAQDGKTQKTYMLSVTDENLIEKSNNADLYSLSFVTAAMSPRFKSSIEEYEVYVKDDVYSVDIIPKSANRYATITVLNGSKEIGDHDGNYSSSLLEDETEFTVKVVSQDKTVTKKYVVTVYRGDEDKQGIYKPITVEDVNFEEEDPIRIDITKYPIVMAEVFNKLKTDYPQKSILFEGNDYTLSIKGSDMKSLIPNTEKFDLSITFTPPDEENIWETITDLDSDNDNLDPVYVHFNHHGSLPAPMKFTISLGSAYRNRELYWNYYNEERDRIDYYGYVVSNAKGTFSLPITHMSTYIVTEKKIVDAENKVGGLNGYYTTGKTNPNTGSEV
ncbi:MAG: cadherin-like beta sandwich domain-containing protein [Candidatus Fimivivens sp.]|nr:cadherin-like beta sandwich domain-containing protein [Candidatus Fimivivens sp.]